MSEDEEWQPTFEKATPLHIGPSRVVVDGAEYVRKPPDRAWEEVDRWNAERDLAVKAAVDATRGNPRDRARDQLADAGVVVQRQFRSDQERIAELERERDALRKELDARRADVRELETDAAATAGELGEYEELVEKLKRELLQAREIVDAAREYVLAAGDFSQLAIAVKRLDGEKP